MTKVFFRCMVSRCKRVLLYDPKEFVPFCSEHVHHNPQQYRDQVVLVSEEEGLKSEQETSNFFS